MTDFFILLSLPPSICILLYHSISIVFDGNINNKTIVMTGPGCPVALGVQYKDKTIDDDDDDYYYDDDDDGFGRWFSYISILCDIIVRLEQFGSPSLSLSLLSIFDIRNQSKPIERENSFYAMFGKIFYGLLQ